MKPLDHPSVKEAAGIGQNYSARDVLAGDLKPGDVLCASRTTIMAYGRKVTEKPGRACFTVRRKNGRVDPVDWNARTRMTIWRPDA